MQLGRFTLALGLVLGAVVARASTFEPLAFRDVVQRADLGFHGAVVAIHESVHPGGRMAFTHVRFRVDSTIVDRHSGIVGGHVMLTFAGGTVASTRIVVAGVPTFAVGDEVVVFAHHDGKTYANPCIGGDRGLLRVLRDRASQVAYPVDAASRAIASFEHGGQSPGQVGAAAVPVVDEPVFTDVVLSIEAGTIAWRPRATPASPPLPERTDRGGAVRASSVVDPPRPDAIVTLASFLECVRAIAR
ncbi:MAG: hypothetical protein IPH13_05135 [Planctomycetes bacterium]|nr:hypothetical protein [Planctomycetota bacterium]MCC7173386.1 hypothetical protein [Planctomycetota bacterium]